MAVVVFVVGVFVDGDVVLAWWFVDDVVSGMGWSIELSHMHLGAMPCAYLAEMWSPSWTGWD